MMQRDYIALHTSIKKFVPVENIDFSHMYITIRDGDELLTDTSDMFLLRQYTGLKDRKGNKIYEKDTIDIKSEKYDFLFLEEGENFVYFADGMFKVGKIPLSYINEKIEIEDRNKYWIG
ncbi:YopX family protein [Clostridium perfringens]|uniref:YopX family protein n=1 Tax=Clostridium perfringens TaxID=1502 RepID=UPI0024BD4C09|nr:YopX family protein [Clostridium perfringens]MDK0553495.1 YopX family protein [Clostridium perfringens]MDT7932943.1 YopX family protein [Clostridium perfringens]MDU2656739.1 YopX family protein [Clostridium perfringens]